MLFFAIFRDTRFIFLLLSMLTGLIGAFIHPLMGYFITDQLGSPPVYIGLYMFVVTMVGLVISQYMGALVDQGRNAKYMYLIATAGMSLGLVIYANTQSFLVVIIAGTLFLSLGNAAIPQMLTMGHQWATQSKADITSFNAQVRAAISFAWIGGPPLAFSLVSIFGFAGSFYFAACVGMMTILFALTCVPDAYKEPSSSTKDQNSKVPLHFWFLTIAILLGAMCNIIYSSSMPLYVITELKISTYVPGLLMGLVATLEIPIMIFSSYLAKYFSKTLLIIIAFLCAILFYMGIFFATELWHFVLLQVINGIYYGLFAGLGLTLMQEQTEGNVGFVSAVYSNAMRLGMMLGTIATSIIAQLHSFQLANIGAMLTALCAIVFMVLFSMSRPARSLKINTG